MQSLIITYMTTSALKKRSHEDYIITKRNERTERVIMAAIVVI